MTGLIEKLKVVTEMPPVVRDVDDVVQRRLLSDENYVDDQLILLSMGDPLREGGSSLASFLVDDLKDVVRPDVARCAGVYVYELLKKNGPLPSVIDSARHDLHAEYFAHSTNYIERMIKRLVHERKIGFLTFLDQFARKTPMEPTAVFSGMLVYRLIEIQGEINKQLGLGYKERTR